MTDYFGIFGTTQEEALARLRPIVDDILKVHQSGDYDRFASLIREDLLARIDRQSFDEAHRQLSGVLSGLSALRFLGSLNRAGNPYLIFAAQGNSQDEELLIKVCIENSLIDPKVTAIWIE